MAKGDGVEFEFDDAWSIQRLPRGITGTGMTDGWAITGCPEGFDPAERMGHQVTLEARRRGAVIRPLGDVVVLMPPLAIETAELRQLVGIVADSIEAAAASYGTAEEPLAA